MRQPELPVGELFILGFENDRLSAIEEFHERFGLGGVILFSRNVESSQKMRELVASLRERTEPSLLVTVDQEGGRVCRIADSEFPTFPSPSYFGFMRDLAGAKHAARVTARNLRQLGVNLNLNPVADVVIDPDNALLRHRSFSSDTVAVSDYVGAVVKEQTAERVASCAKHFPGLGGSTIDPHKKMAHSDRPAKDFEELLFPPFVKAISAGCDAVMTTHISVPSLDKSQPATFSREIVSGILRKQLGFEGIIVSDDLDMGAVANEDEAAVKALTAGHDMALICHSIDRQIECAHRVARAVTEGTLDAAEIEKSVLRVKALKRKFTVA